MEKSASKTRERIPLGKKTMEMTFENITVIYLLPKKLFFTRTILDQKIWIEMFCYHNENTDFANPKFVLVMLIYLVTHYNIMDNPFVHSHHAQHEIPGYYTFSNSIPLFVFINEDYMLKNLGFLSKLLELHMLNK